MLLYGHALDRPCFLLPVQHSYPGLTWVGATHLKTVFRKRAFLTSVQSSTHSPQLPLRRRWYIGEEYFVLIVQFQWRLIKVGTLSKRHPLEVERSLVSLSTEPNFPFHFLPVQAFRIHFDPGDFYPGDQTMKSL